MARLWWREASGAVADLGVLLPIALALIVVNGLSVTAVIVPAGLAYVAVAVIFRVPVAVQPLKAFGAIAIATGAGPDVIAAGALLMGVVFTLLGAFGLLHRLATVVPPSVIRGVQASVGLTLCVVAWRLVAHPPASFVGPLHPAVAGAIAVGILAVLLAFRGPAALIAVTVAMVAAVVVAIVLDGGALAASGATILGPTPIQVPHLTGANLALAATALVLPQIPVTLANSCLAPADAARLYFGAAGRRVAPDRLALTLGIANVGIGAVGGMPVCHGAGGMSAHYFFGARTWRAPLLMGGALVAAGLIAARPLAAILPSFPLSVLAALIAAAGVAHLRLLGDVRGTLAWGIVAMIAVAGVFGYLAVGVLVGVAVHLVARRVEAGPGTREAVAATAATAVRTGGGRT